MFGTAAKIAYKHLSFVAFWDSTVAEYNSSMKLKKIELGLEGDLYWPKICIVHVPGNASAATIPADATQEETEEIIRSWNTAAVLRVSPVDGKAMVGFWVDNEHCQYLNVPVETDPGGLFAMRVGDGDTNFFLIPQDHQTNYTLEFVAVVGVDDPKYTDVPLY